MLLRLSWLLGERGVALLPLLVVAEYLDVVLHCCVTALSGTVQNYLREFDPPIDLSRSVCGHSVRNCELVSDGCGACVRWMRDRKTNIMEALVS